MAITQTIGRDRLNIHGAVDLETGQTRMLDVLMVNAASTIMLLMAIEAMASRVASCIAFGALHVEDAIEDLLLDVVGPSAIAAANSPRSQSASEQTGG